MKKFNSEEEKKEYFRQKQAERRAKTGARVVVTVQPLPLDNELNVSMEWDAEKYPNRRAFEIAVARVARAQRYAAMFPGRIHGDDIKFQKLEWQYENEGLPSVRRKETHLVT